MKSQDTTTIQITKKVRAQLDVIGDIHSESYNQIVERLIRQSREMGKK